MRVFILMRNLLSWPRAMAQTLAQQSHEVIFVDNDSSYQPLLDYYETCGHRVVRLPNLGKLAVWEAELDKEQTGFYVVTDPDLGIDMIPSDWDQYLMRGFEHDGVACVGLSLDETRVPPENPAFWLDEFYRYPEGNPAVWGRPFNNQFFVAPIDTTFAMYHSKVNVPARTQGGFTLRSARPYTARHWPWHIALGPSTDPAAFVVPFDDEIEYYFDTCTRDSFTWARIQSMLAAYKGTKS